MENSDLTKMLRTFASFAGQRRASLHKMAVCECCGKSGGRDAVDEAGAVAQVVHDAAALFLDPETSRQIAAQAEIAFMREMDRPKAE
jgi:hypothetical protein